MTIFLDSFPQVKETKAKVTKQYYIKIKKILHSEGNW